MLNAAVHPARGKVYFLILLAMCAVIGTALGFEHIAGYQPCKLCLQQREPWYFAIPVTALATLSVFMKWPACVSRGLLIVAGIAMIYSLVLGIHHSGVEWGFWMGPSDCGAVEGGLAASTGDFLKQLEQSVPPSCSEAPGRFIGLSFAGWNAVASLMLAVVALWTAMRDRA